MDEYAAKPANWVPAPEYFAIRRGEGRFMLSVPVAHQTRNLMAQIAHRNGVTMVEFARTAIEKALIHECTVRPWDDWTPKGQDNNTN